LGALSELRHDTEAAIAFYDEAIALYKGKEYSVGLGVSYGRRGYARHQVGQTLESIQDVLRSAFVLSRTDSPEIATSMNILQYLRAELGGHFVSECEKAHRAVSEVYGSDTAQDLAEFKVFAKEQCSTG
jgi:hypothetical protein